MKFFLTLLVFLLLFSSSLCSSELKIVLRKDYEEIFSLMIGVVSETDQENVEDFYRSLQCLGDKIIEIENIILKKNTPLRGYYGSKSISYAQARQNFQREAYDLKSFFESKNNKNAVNILNQIINKSNRLNLLDGPLAVTR